MTNNLKDGVPFGCYVEFECYRCCFKYFDWRSKLYQIICFRLLMFFHLVGVLNWLFLKTFVVLRVRFRKVPPPPPKITSAFLRQQIVSINGLK